MLKSTSVVGGMTLLSRILGLLRDIAFAKYFAPGVGMDAFLVAFKIPNFMRRLFGEGAFSQAFVPVISEYKTTREQAEVKQLVDGVAGVFGLLLLAVTVIGVAGAPLLVMVFAPGFIDDGDKFELTVSLLRITFPYLFFISLTAFAAGILNTYGRFGVPAFTPVLLNVSLILAAVVFAGQSAEPVSALAAGVFIAGLLQLILQLPFLARIGLLPVPRWRAARDGVRKIMRLMLPALFGSSVAQINLLIDTLIASFLVTGSVSWLYFSDRLMEFPLGVFAIALATVILPSLSERHAEKSAAEFSATLDWALRLVCLLGIPAAIGLLVLAGPMLATLFQYGEFTARDVRMAEASLMAYAFGLFGFTLIKVLAPGYFARQDTKTPVRFGVYAMFVNITLNLVLVVWLVRSEFFAPHAGLALATSLAALLNGCLLFLGLRRRGVYQPGGGWFLLMLRVLSANAVMAAALWYLKGDLQVWIGLSAPERAARLAAFVIGGGLLYGASVLALGLRPRHFKSPITRGASV